MQQQVNEHHVRLSAQRCSRPTKFTEHVRQCLCNSMHSSVSNTNDVTTDSCHSFTEVSNKKRLKSDQSCIHSLTEADFTASDRL